MALVRCVLAVTGVVMAMMLRPTLAQDLGEHICHNYERLKKCLKAHMRDIAQKDK